MVIIKYMDILNIPYMWYIRNILYFFFGIILPVE